MNYLLVALDVRNIMKDYLIFLNCILNGNHTKIYLLKNKIV